MSPFNPPGDDYLDAWVWFKGNPIERGWIIGLLEGIAEINPSLVPTKEGDGPKLINQKKAERTTPKETILNVVNALEKRYNLASESFISLEGGRRNRGYHLHIGRELGPWNSLSSASISVRASDIESLHAESSVPRIFEFLIRRTNPEYGNLAMSHEKEEKNTVPVRNKLGNITAWMNPGLRPEDGLFAIYHLNYFGPAYLNFFGRDKFDSIRKTKAVVQDHPSGGITVRVGETPQDWRKESNITLSMEIVRILDHNAFMDRNAPDSKLESPFKRVMRTEDGTHDPLLSRMSPMLEGEEEWIKEQSRDFIKGMKKTFGTKMGLDEDSLEKLDDLIEDGWAGKTPEHLDLVVASFGSYMGEALKAVHGGAWKVDPDSGERAVVISNKVAVFPFSKIEKRFRNGKEDSISMLLRLIERGLEKP